MPFGQYKDMQDCIKNNSDKERPGAYCAQIHKNITGKWPSQKERLKVLKEGFVINSQTRRDIIELYHKGLNAKEISRRLRLDLELVEDFLDTYIDEGFKQKEAINSSDRKDINEDIRILSTIIKKRLKILKESLKESDKIPSVDELSDAIVQVGDNFNNVVAYLKKKGFSGSAIALGWKKLQQTDWKK